MDYRILWAKSDPYHPLWCHMLDVAAVCRALYPRFGPVPGLDRDSVCYFAALHDLGKADPLFQNKAPILADELRSQGLRLPKEVCSFRHEARSAGWVKSKLSRSGWGENSAPVIAAALRGHHGNFKSTCLDEDPTRARTIQFEELRTDIESVIANAIGVTVQPVEIFQDASVSGLTLSALIVMSDWIASNDELFDYYAFDQNAEPKQYWISACAKAENVVAELGLRTSSLCPAESPIKFCDLFPQIEFPRPTQVALESLCNNTLAPGLVVIEAPMGEGKTEAAFYLVDHWRRTAGRQGAYIALPTMATSNQMHSRYGEFLQNVDHDVPPPRLLHGMAWLFEEDAPLIEPKIDGQDGSADRHLAWSWFSGSKRSLIFPESVGTVDQALRAALRVKHGILRLLGLSPRTLVIDEVHAYDEYMTTIMERLLNWCRALQIPVILLSATLSRGQKERLVRAYGGHIETSKRGECVPYPLITHVKSDGSVIETGTQTASPHREISLKRHMGAFGDYRHAATLAASLAQPGGCICIIVNTVKRAQDVYLQLKRLGLDGTELILFHARFRAEARQKIEDRVVRLFGKDAGDARPKRAILVATQVVEQSLDVDFDAMLTDLAPIDLLLQRAGRLHRHSRIRPTDHGTPTLHVLMPINSDWNEGDFKPPVYDREIMLRTIGLLLTRDVITLPHDFRPLVEGCYDSREPMAGIEVKSLAQAAEQRDTDRDEDEQKAVSVCIPSPEKGKFVLAETTDHLEDSESGGAYSYIRPQTRLGDDSLQLLVLHSDALMKAAQDDHPRSRSVIRELYLQKAAVPAWWLRDFEPQSGSDIYCPDDGWLRGNNVIRLRDGKITGTVRGTPVTIFDCPETGLFRVVGGGDGE